MSKLKPNKHGNEGAEMLDCEVVDAMAQRCTSCLLYID